MKNSEMKLKPCLDEIRHVVNTSSGLKRKEYLFYVRYLTWLRQLRYIDCCDYIYYKEVLSDLYYNNPLFCCAPPLHS